MLIIKKLIGSYCSLLLTRCSSKCRIIDVNYNWYDGICRNNISRFFQKNWKCSLLLLNLSINCKNNRYIRPIGYFGLIDYIAAAIFSLYIGYDMYRSTQVQRTVTNALHISVSLYLDIINLFLSLINILRK